ncbi:hypothetical protein [Haloterrigena salinisoli]|uniref:DUF7573 domain-containing protein n=1 Tax=Haloterrigena salinisoli TaxID=3132747 RepID=UPI0030D2CA8B
MTDDATLTDFGGSEPSDADGARDGDSTSETDSDPNSDTELDHDSDSRDSGPAQSESDDSDPERVESDHGAVENDPAADTDEGTSGDAGLSTYGWGEYTCHRCADETERVWREDGDLVCPDCKSW